MKLEAVFFKVFLLIFGLVVFYFLGVGLVTQPWEGDSLAYHLPLANQLLAGNFNHYDNLLFYYPATVHVWLAGFKLLHLPLQWFNVVGLIWLFSGVWWLGRKVGLSQAWSGVLAVVVALLTPVARLIGTQTVDIYLAGIYALLVAILIEPKAQRHYFLRLGLLSGALVGAKYTGPLFLLPLGVVFGRPVLKVAQKSWLMMAILLVITVGGMWYLRNWLVKGDLIFPAHDPSFTWVNWHTWQTLFQVPGGWWYLTESLISEYLFWPLLLVGLVVLALRKKLRPLELKLCLLGFGNFVIHLLTPASINNVLSDLRYTVPTFVCLITATFLYARRQRRQLELGLISLISVVASLSLILPHRPKIYFLYGILVGLGWLVQRQLKPDRLKR